MHRVHDHRQPHAFKAAAQAIEIELVAQARQVLSAGVKAFGVALDRSGDAAGGQATLHGGGEIALHRSTKGAFDLEAKPFRRVVAGCDHQGSEGLTLHHSPAAGRSGHRSAGQEGMKAAASDGRGDGGRQLRCQEAAVVADHDGFAAVSGGSAMGQFLGRRGRDGEQALNGDVDPEDAAPAIGAEGNR